MVKPAAEPVYEPIAVAIALALYGYNVAPAERAKKIYDHFKGECADMFDLTDYMVRYGSAPTALAFPSAEVYILHALEREEARRRVQKERRGSRDVYPGACSPDESFIDTVTEADIDFAEGRE
jgi:hypothetical protein